MPDPESGAAEPVAVCWRCGVRPSDPTLLNLGEKGVGEELTGLCLGCFGEVMNPVVNGDGEVEDYTLWELDELMVELDERDLRAYLGQDEAQHLYQAAGILTRDDAGLPQRLPPMTGQQLKMSLHAGHPAADVNFILPDGRKVTPEEVFDLMSNRKRYDDGS